MLWDSETDALADSDVKMDSEIDSDRDSESEALDDSDLKMDSEIDLLSITELLWESETEAERETMALVEADWDVATDPN